MAVALNAFRSIYLSIENALTVEVQECMAGSGIAQDVVGWDLFQAGKKLLL